MCALWLIEQKEDTACERKLVLSTLAGILDLRTKLKLEFAEGINTKDVTATLITYDAWTITVEVTVLKDTPSTWTGIGVSCFFRIPDPEAREQDQLLTFDSHINSVQLQSSNIVQLVLALPRTIKTAQRRRSVRVEVDQSKVPALKFWRELPAGVNIVTKLPLLNSESNAKRGLKVRNMSANGLSLLVQFSLMNKVLPNPHKGERFSFYFKAVFKPGCPATPFWVNAVLRNIANSLQKGESGLGFEFLAEGVLGEDKRLVWRPLKCGEVSSLGKFIFNWNLELYREKESCAG